MNTIFEQPFQDKSKMKLLVRAHAGPGVGTGHVMRTLALGQAWKRLGGTVAFVSGELPIGLVAKIQSEKFDFYKLDNPLCESEDAKQTADLAMDLGADWIALDGYLFDDNYQAELSSTDCRLIVIDDYQHADHKHADIIVNQNAYANAENYQRSSTAKILAGPSFALLRSEFNAFATNQSVDQFAQPTSSPTCSSTKHIVKQARRILVTFGGEDADNWTLKTLQVLSDLNRKQLIVDCVVGACYQHMRELEVFKKTANMSLRIHRNVDRMSALMHRVDVAISAGGSTCYELARCGVPTIVASIADNQVPVAMAMSRLGVMISLDELGATGQRAHSDPTKRLTSTIRKLLNDYDTRKTMSELGTALVDGNGGFRIASQMASMLCSFRDAQYEDAELLWQWRNDPEVRSVSFSQDVISLDSHRDWLAKRLDDSGTKIWIAQDQSHRPVGQIRFDSHVDGQISVISIILDQSVRGRGLGQHLIEKACRAFFDSNSSQEIVAQIKPGNTASERAFRRAGFVAIEPMIIDGKIANQFVLARNETDEIASEPRLRRSA